MCEHNLKIDYITIEEDFICKLDNLQKLSGIQI